MRKLFYIGLVLILSLNARGQVERGSVLIKGGTLLTITKGTQESTDLLIKDGKITQIGKNIPVPQGVKVIDASGMYVMPGII
ncbi:MAG TPA: amidohydrolase, partial [Chryseolinea sp.]